MPLRSLPKVRECSVKWYQSPSTSASLDGVFGDAWREGL